MSVGTIIAKLVHPQQRRDANFKLERVEKRRVMRVKLEIVHTDGEGELKHELDRAGSGT